MPHICAALTGLSGLQKKRLKMKLGEGCAVVSEELEVEHWEQIRYDSTSLFTCIKSSTDCFKQVKCCVAVRQFRC